MSDTLPPLPRAAVDEHNLQGGRLLYTADQMREYALTARQQVSQPQAAPQAQAAGQDEREAFEAWFKSFRHGGKSERDVCFDAWQARAALAQHPNLSDRAVQKRLAAQWGHGVAQLQPLTWEQIESVRAQVFAKALQLRDGCDDETWDHWFACAIEHAHGIGATTGKEPT